MVEVEVEVLRAVGEVGVHNLNLQCGRPGTERNRPVGRGVPL